MIISKKWLTSILAASLLFGFAGCKKDAPKSQDEVTQKVQALADGKWDKAEVNALLAFVPEDTPFVFASTREFDINHPAYKKVFEKTKVVMEQLNNLMQKSMAKTDEEGAKIANKMMSDLKALISDYANVAKDYGMNPEHNDSIIYMDGSLVVAKITADDGAKFQAKIEEYTKMLPDLSITEVKAGTDSFIEYGIKDSSEEKYAAYINYGKNIITIVLNADANNTAELARTLKVADKQLLKSKLGKVSSDVAALGYVNNEAIVDKIFASDILKEEEELAELSTPECNAEIKAIVADYPRLNMVYRIKNDSEFSSDFSLVINNKDALKRLESLHAESIKITNDKTMLSMGINIDVGKAIAWFKETATSISSKQYACAPLKAAATEIGKLPGLLLLPQAAQFIAIAEGISGISFALDNFSYTEIENNKFDSIQALVDVSGPTIGKSLPSALALAAAVSPEIATIRPNAEEATTIDLAKLDVGNLSIQAYMSDTDFLIGTKNYDIKTIAKSPRKANPNFLELSLNTSFYNMFLKDENDDDLVAFKQILDALNFSYTWTIGTDSEGLSGSVVVKF